MSFYESDLETSIVDYCGRLGQDSLLVQGAGGNVSWKDENTLWIKASGKWLADASKDIFVPVNLQHLRTAVEHARFDVKPELMVECALKPSIETLLHALMPQKVVVHLHAVEILAHLVRDNCEEQFQLLLADAPGWVMVDYYKPGAELARAVNAAIEHRTDTKVVFLRNHGVVIGGDSVEDVDRTLTQLIERLTYPTSRSALQEPSLLPGMLSGAKGYIPIKDSALHELALEPDMFAAARTSWALYPDHVVFLGAQAHTYESFEALATELAVSGNAPELVFVQGQGIYVKTEFTSAKYAQLRCYYDVIRRQSARASIRALSQHQIHELLNWDAELYRIQVSQ